jgi:hypothetical protein
MSSVYGPYSSFQARWSGIDNPRTISSPGRCDLSGAWREGRPGCLLADREFYRALREAHPRLKVVLNAPESAGTDFAYWRSEVAPYSFFLSMK